MSLRDEVTRALSRFFAVACDGEAVRFVAHGLQEVQGRAVGRQAEGFAGEREDEFFHAGFAFGAFGDADQGDVQPEFFPYGYGDADLSFAAVNQYDIGPFDGLAVGFGFLHFAVAAGEDFAHGGVVVAGFGGSFQNISRLPEYLKAHGKIFEAQGYSAFSTATAALINLIWKLCLTKAGKLFRLPYMKMFPIRQAEFI